MHIKKIHMSKYKRFFDLTIDLGENPRRIVALVGPNGCGKSSVFDAMLYVMKALAPIGNTNSHQDVQYHSLEGKPLYDYQNIQIEIDQGDFLTVYRSKRAQGLEKTIFSFRSSFRYNSGLHISNVQAVDEIQLNNYGASTASDIDQRIEQNYRRLNAKFCHYRDENDLRPSEAKDAIVKYLNDAIKNCLDLEITSMGNIESNEGTLYFKKSDSDIVFDYSVLSAGEKETIDLLLDLYLRKDIYKDSIYIIDEPELHLNTSIQRSLLMEINKMIPDNCQIWIATHSIGFLRALQEELQDDSQIIEFDSHNKWASDTYVLTPAILSRSMWQKIFATALDDLAKLVCPKTIIYCEGRADPRPDGTERGLDATIYNQIFASKYPDVLFVSSGGNTELDQRSDIALVVLSKIFPEITIFVLKDRDMASGKVVTEEQRQEYLRNNPDNHRVLIRYEIENYLYDKEILKRYCNKNNNSFDEGSYSSFVTDIVNQNLKDSTGRIKNICGITTSVNQERFKINLAEFITQDTEIYKELEKVIFDRV